MRARLDTLEQRFNIHIKQYEARGNLHAKHNQIQAAFAEEINELNAKIAHQNEQIAGQGLILGQQGVTLGQHEKLFKEMKIIWEKIATEMGDMKTYIKIAEDRQSFKRYLLDVFFKSIPLISFGLLILYKIW